MDSEASDVAPRLPSTTSSVTIPEQVSSTSADPLPIPRASPADSSEINVPRLRPSSSSPTQKPCDGMPSNPPQPDATSSSAAIDIDDSAALPLPSFKPYNRRGQPSSLKGRRKSVDSRPLMRGGTTKISVRMKPRPAAAATSSTTESTPLTSQRDPEPSSVPLPPAPPLKVSLSCSRKPHASPPRKFLIKGEVEISEDGTFVGSNSDGGDGNPGSFIAAGTLRPRYSVSCRLTRKPQAAAVSATGPPTSESPAEAEARDVSAAAATSDPAGSETATHHEGAVHAEKEDQSPPPQHEEAARLAEALQEIQCRERQLKVREDALKLGQKRLRQDRDAFEKEKRQFQEGQRQQQKPQQEPAADATATSAAATAAQDDDNACKSRTARRSRSRSKPRGKVVADDSWLRGHHRNVKKDQQDHRYASWSTVDSSSSSRSGGSRQSSTSYPSDAESINTTTTASAYSPLPSPSLSSSSKPEPALAPTLTWTPADLPSSLAAYNARWAALPRRSARVPYPAPNHTAAELRDASHLRSSPNLPSYWWWVANSDDRDHHDAIVQYNAVHFFLVARGVACEPVVSGGGMGLRPNYGGGLRSVPVDGQYEGQVSLRALVREVRQELRRWHEDGLKYRSDGGGVDGDAERKANEELAKDETARAVFRAFTELRDELLAEMRLRKEIEDAAAAAAELREQWARAACGSGAAESRAWEGMDWTVLSECLL